MTKEEKAIYDKKYKEKNKEKLKKQNKVWYEENREKILNVVWTEEKRIKRRVHYNKYYKKNSKKFIEMTININKKNKAIVIKHYGNNKTACLRCGFKNINCLEIDHINNNGAEDRKKTKLTGASMYRWLINNNFPKGYQTLCRNCNWLKHIKNYKKIKKYD